MSKDEAGSGVDTLSRTKDRVKRPKLYQVLLLNDDYTTMDFVVSVLETIFHKSPPEAIRVMLQVHRNGSGLCGTYPLEIAETKVVLVHDRARKTGFPLQCEIRAE
jgi:ATP-dependent Clp protease adaptor protein ClpS